MESRHRAPRGVLSHMTVRSFLAALPRASFMAPWLRTSDRGPGAVQSLKRHALPAENQRADTMQNHLTKRHMAMAGLSLALLAVLCFSPSLFGDRVSAAIDGLGAADPGLLWAAAIAFAGTSICGALAWRAALRASGSPLPLVDASARYAVGCGVNAIAPAHVGSALRVALFGRVTTGGCWTVSGAAAAVGVTRVVWLGALIAIGSAGGVLPLWPLFAIAAIVGGACAVGILSRRISLPVKIEQLLTAFRSLAASPRDLAIVAGWALAGAAAKVAAATAVVAALGIDNPLRAALVLVPAVELAAILPITPGQCRARERRRCPRARLPGRRGEDGAVGGNRVRCRRALDGDGDRCRRGTCARRPVGAPVPPRRRRRRRRKPRRDRVRRDRAAARCLTGPRSTDARGGRARVARRRQGRGTRARA